MATLRDIKKRIGAVKNIEQITRAMKMVAAAKLRKAQERIMAARPYARHLRSILAHVAERVPPETHPLLKPNPPHHGIAVLVVTADRGLCGSFNAGILRRARRFMQEHASSAGGPIRLYLVGRKSVSYFKFHHADIFGSMQDFFRLLDFSHGVKVTNDLVGHYMTEKPSALHVIYNEFKSAVAQKLVVEQLLPFSPAGVGSESGTPTLEAPEALIRDAGTWGRGAADPAGPGDGHATRTQADYLYEPPDPAAVLTNLIKLDLEVQIFTIFLESYSAEQAARMIAMGNAADNAVELKSGLTLSYNRVRQAGITKEIAEIVGGAEALK